MQNQKTILGIAAAILVALLIGTSSLYIRNGRLKEAVNGEKLQSEKLLSEKLLLTRQIDQFRGEITVLKGKNRESDQRLEKADRDLTLLETRLQQLDKKAAGARQAKQQLAALKKLRKTLAAELQSVKAYNGHRLQHFQLILRAGTYRHIGACFHSFGGAVYLY